MEIDVTPKNQNPSIRNDKCVFLLGAGFTAEHGHPVMSAYMPRAMARCLERQKQVEERDKQVEERDKIVESYMQLFDFRRKFIEAAWVSSANWNNIEHLYTQADLLRLAGFEHAKSLCDSLAWSIWDVYQKDYADRPVALFDMLRPIITSGLKPVLLTTNYDLSLERSINQARAAFPVDYYYPGFSGDKIGDSVVSFTQASDAWPCATDKVLIPLMKIHGSVNWFTWDNADRCKTERIPVSALLDFEQYALGSAMVDIDRIRCDLTESEDADPGFKPMIVPPSLGKSADPGPTPHQLKVAIDAIGSARDLWIVGYSFPDTDVFMSRMIVEGLRCNHGFERLFVVNIDSENQWQGRLKRVFSDLFCRIHVTYIQSTASSFMRLCSRYISYSELTKVLSIGGKINGSGVFTPNGAV